MLRKSAFATLVLLMAAALAFAGPRATAAPLAQATPTPEHEMENGDEHTDEHEHGERIDAGGATIKIVSPADGAVIQGASVTVQVETTNWPLGEGKHFHLYVDGAERGMSQGTGNTLAANDLEPGEHEIEVVLSNEEHQELDAEDMITIRVEAAASAALAASADGTPLLVGGIVVAVLAVGGIAFAISRRK